MAASATPPPLTRRRLLAGATAASLSGFVARAGALEPTAPVVSGGRTKITVLGTLGGQAITHLTGADVRCGTSIVIDVDGELTLVDCGIGCLHRLLEAGYDANQVRNVLITHHHIDHNADLGNVAAFAWASTLDSTQTAKRMDIYGPTGTHAYEAGYKHASRLSIADEQRGWGKRPAFNRFARWHELSATRRSRKVFSGPRFDVTCVRVRHGQVPALGYRIRTPDVDIVLSGDRGPRGDTFAAFARGAAVLFHEVLDPGLVVPVLKAQHAAPALISHIMNDHCDPQAVGRVASAAGVQTLVLYHLIPGNRAVPDDSWVAAVQPYFAGRIIVARDLLVV